MLAPVGDSRYAQLRPNLALAPGAGTDLHRGPEPAAGTPAAAALATLHGEGKVSAFPAIGYDHPDQSHFTSRHYYEIGELQVGYRTGWLGRYLDAVGDDENPLQGLSLDGSLSPMIATADKPVAAIDSVDGYDLWSRGRRPDRSEMYRSFARFGSLPVRLPRPRPGAPRHRRRPTSCARTWPASATSAARSPTPTTWFAHKLAGLAAYIAVGLPMRVVTVRAPGGYDTHADQAADLEDNLRGPARGSSPSSATSRRAASPTGC